MRGLTEAGAFIRPIVEETVRIELRMDAIAVADDGCTVLTERWDFLYYPSGVVELPIMGIFVVQDGLITQWRDYTDGASAAAQFKQAGVSLVLPAGQ
jgi:limonene-1,2-epoxide hydrolase